MTNTLMLKAKIVGAGLSVKETSEKIGLSTYGFYKKMYNKSEFKASEVTALAQLLGLRNDEITLIFFSKCRI